MNQKSNPILFIFGIVVLFNLIGVALQSQNIIYITKPLLLTLLSVYFFLATKGNNTIYKKLMFLGLIFSIGGDTFLMFDGYFVFGLGCFLLTQVFYTIAFAKYPNFKKGLLFQKPWYVLPLVIFWVVLIRFLWDGLGDFQIPVVVYSIVITLMAISCLNMKNRIASKHFQWLFAGVLLFLLSDSVIALNKFKATDFPIPNAGFIIMLTYIIAQFLIATQSVSILEKENTN